MQPEPSDHLQPSLRALEQAIYSHELWVKDLLRTIICRLPVDRRDLDADAHHHCRFGQWFYDDAPRELRRLDGFAAMESEHEHLHRLAAKLLHTVMSDESIHSNDYDEFANTRDRLLLQLQTLKQQIEEMLYNRDPLTGAETRTQMLPVLRDLHAMAQRKVLDCCVSIMDLDHFKQVNDNFGHQAGDRVLSAAVSRMQEVLRSYDKVFRYGGEEFLILMPNTELSVAHTVVERIRERLAAEPLTHHNGTPVSITASFGITWLDSGCGVEESIHRADMAMYAAKKAGRNCTIVWSPELADPHATNGVHRRDPPPG
ncbi:diguanylate cyclase [Sinimarinibacterium sp. CAU 1509]|uniref:diguanylate cyclase n=1 Tax=Sinimarinibacterium sp. CAU 1509 TaxID=2562283 RepID=UPI00146C58C8|nr:diguanylate cyclase [Sinimarinibacterium sp. CAU 1509]